jgi:hypothetical protein
MVAAAVGKIQLKLDVRWRGNAEAVFYKLTFDYERGVSSKLCCGNWAKLVAVD